MPGSGEIGLCRDQLADRGDRPERKGRVLIRSLRATRRIVRIRIAIRDLGGSNRLIRDGLQRLAERCGM